MDRSRIEEVERNMEATRDRMAATIAELDDVVSSRASAAKEAVDVRTYVARYPWPTLLLALGAGILLARSGADGKAVRSARRAPELAKRGAGRAAGAVRGKFRRGSAGMESDDEILLTSDGMGADTSPGTGSAGREGLAWRVTTALHGDEMLEEMRAEADRIGGTGARLSGGDGLGA